MTKAGTPQAEKNGDKKNAAPFTIREVKIAGEIGCTKEQIRARRECFLVEGRHWARVDKGVMLSPLGAEILRATKNVELPIDPPAPTPAEPAKQPKALLLYNNPPPWSLDFTGELIAWASPIRNERLLIAYLPGTDPSNPRNLVNVLVRSNRNFMRGMKLKAHHVEGNRFELIGPCPKWRGRY